MGASLTRSTVLDALFAVSSFDFAVVARSASVITRAVSVFDVLISALQYSSTVQQYFKSASYERRWCRKIRLSYGRNGRGLFKCNVSPAESLARDSQCQAALLAVSASHRGGVATLTSTSFLEYFRVRLWNVCHRPFYVFRSPKANLNSPRPCARN